MFIILWIEEKKNICLLGQLIIFSPLYRDFLHSDNNVNQEREIEKKENAYWSNQGDDGNAEARPSQVCCNSRKSDSKLNRRINLTQEQKSTLIYTVICGVDCLIS